MPTADDSPAPPEGRPPHPATRPRGTTVQPKVARKAAGPHPATIPRDAAVQPKKAGRDGPPHPAAAQKDTTVQPRKAGKTRGPHPATVPHTAVQLKKVGEGRPPHPAAVAKDTTVQPRKAGKARGPHPATVPHTAVQLKKVGEGRPPHPATVRREGANAAIQPSSRKAKYYKKGSKGGIEVYLNGGKKAIAATNQSKASGHAERIAVGQAPSGNITLEQNAWPCSECHTWLEQQSQTLGVTITVTVTEDHGSYSLDHRNDGVALGDTGTIVYANGGSTTTVD